MSDQWIVTIRSMVAADIDQLMDIATRLDHAPHWPRRFYEAVLEDSSPNRIALIAESVRTSRIVGFAIALVLPPVAELESIAVTAEFQHQGIARQLFEAIAAEISPAQVSEVVLEVRESNRPAREFYASLAFVEEGRRPRYYADPVEDGILMRLRLGCTVASSDNAPAPE